VLPEVEVVPFRFKRAEVVLTQTVERLVGLGQPLLSHVLVSSPGTVAAMIVRPPSFSSETGAPAGRRTPPCPWRGSMRTRSFD